VEKDGAEERMEKKRDRERERSEDEKKSQFKKLKNPLPSDFSMAEVNP
jgi:hypothetical protein